MTPTATCGPWRSWLLHTHCCTPPQVCMGVCFKQICWFPRSCTLTEKLALVKVANIMARSMILCDLIGTMRTSLWKWSYSFSFYALSLIGKHLAANCASYVAITIILWISSSLDVNVQYICFNRVIELFNRVLPCWRAIEPLLDPCCYHSTILDVY